MNFLSHLVFLFLLSLFITVIIPRSTNSSGLDLFGAAYRLAATNIPQKVLIFIKGKILSVKNFFTNCFIKRQQNITAKSVILIMAVITSAIYIFQSDNSLFTGRYNHTRHLTTFYISRSRSCIQQADFNPACQYAGMAVWNRVCLPDGKKYDKHNDTETISTIINMMMYNRKQQLKSQQNKTIIGLLTEIIMQNPKDPKKRIPSIILPSTVRQNHKAEYNPFYTFYSKCISFVRNKILHSYTTMKSAISYGMTQHHVSQIITSTFRT